MKTCTKCNETLPLDCFGSYIRNNKKRCYQSCCKSCKREYNKKWRDDRTEEYITRYKKEQCDYQKKYLSDSTNKERRKAVIKAYDITNRDKRNEMNRARRKILIENLNYRYVIEILSKYTGLKCADIPDSLVQLKREQLILKRKLRNHE